MQAMRDGTLPSADEAAQLLELAGGVDAPRAPSAKRARTAGQDEAVDLLGGCSGAPLQVHAQMLELSEHNLVPITNPSQRARKQILDDTIYGIPELWTQAFKYKYNTPKSSSPQGWRWKSSGGRVRLCQGGG